MKVFMSWSGARSKATAELLHEWIKCVIQASRPWISTRGIGRGSVWFNEINNELKDTNVGVICLTHQNKNAPWILFEAGALAKGLSTNKVCTFLVDLHPADIQDPLAQFNHTTPTKDGLMSLAATLNSALEFPLDSLTLDSVFEAFWPQFEQNFAAMLARLPQEAVVEVRSETSLLEEILESTRGLSHRIRAMEEVNAKRHPNAGGVVITGHAPTITQQRSDSGDSLTTQDAIKLVAEFAEQGRSAQDAYVKLVRTIGTRRANQIFDSCVEIFYPEADNEVKNGH